MNTLINITCFVVEANRFHRQFTRDKKVEYELLNENLINETHHSWHTANFTSVRVALVSSRSYAYSYSICYGSRNFQVPSQNYQIYDSEATLWS